MPTPVIAVAASKGGVGKTTLVLALAAVHAHAKDRVLVVDLDPQANLTLPLLTATPPEFTVYDVLASRPAPGAAASAIIWSGWGGVDLLAASRGGDDGRYLARVETDTAIGVEQRLCRALEGVTDDYDVVLIDCPPSLGRLAVNGLVAASHVLCVTELGLASLRGVGQTLQTVSVVQEAYNPGLQVAGIVPNRMEPRLSEQRARLAELTAAYGDLVWPAVPQRAAVAAAYGAGVPITDAGPGAAPALAVIRQHTGRLIRLTG